MPRIALPARPSEVRATIKRLADERNVSLAALSRMARLNDDFLATFVRTGKPDELPASAVPLLSAFLRVPSEDLGHAAPPSISGRR